MVLSCKVNRSSINELTLTVSLKCNVNTPTFMLTSKLIKNGLCMSVIKIETGRGCWLVITTTGLPLVSRTDVRMTANQVVSLVTANLSNLLISFLS